MYVKYHAQDADLVPYGLSVLANLTGDWEDIQLERYNKEKNHTFNFLLSPQSFYVMREAAYTNYFSCSSHHLLNAIKVSLVLINIKSQ